MKKYLNPNIQILLDKYITSEKYGEYKPILDEIVQRRFFEFEMEGNYARNQILKLVSLLDSIEFVDEFVDNNNICAKYFRQQKKIVINSKIFSMLEQDFRSQNPNCTEDEVKNI